MKEIIIATKNPGKVQEFKNEFKQYFPETNVLSLLDLPELPEIPETGTTFAENAEQKVRAIMKLYPTTILADDSGLCVDALNGAPGIYSARYAGDHDDKANLVKLENELTGVPIDKRTAHFTTAVVLISPNQKEQVFMGQTDGLILDKPIGDNGFGYDPVFYYPPFKKTFAQMTTSEKNQISHRGKAMQKLIEYLRSNR